ncbi:hypothetical protein H0H81_004289 [Sphagnurus paluster]|uniref:NAD(P)-binding protein n=1 Tax=Sphagnurus paluster TaxID=117069 RepID=A0A9P7GS09_9AGAR|nr:hypothetical protein H0H81_004289 [Sphagnurus paluster]
MTGAIFKLIRDLFPPKSKYSVEDIPDLTGRVIIVTGGNTGIGKETAKALLAHNAKVYIAGRNQAKVEDAIRDLQSETGKTAIFLKVDLADLHSVKAGAQSFLNREKELHVLFNNGGVMNPPVEQITAQGYDLQFGTNSLGHFYFTKLLLPALFAGTKTSGDGKARVVNTSSSSHLLGKLDFETLTDTPKRKKQPTFTLYAQSKFANVVFSKELARRYGDQGIVSIAVNPGIIDSDLQRHANNGPVTQLMQRSLRYPAAQGALTQLYVGTSPEGAKLNGKYLIPWARIGNPLEATENAEQARELWAWAEEQVAKI